MMENVVQKVLAGDRLAISRLITAVENRQDGVAGVIDDLFPYGGHAFIIGITGSPGCGKSSLVNSLAYRIRHPRDNEKTQKVAIVALDPTSAFSGGALLGDRVRMRDLAGDEGVFIRSMASRGALGGLNAAIFQVIHILDSAGFDFIFIETVGVGQSEIEIAQLAHTVIVVEAPGMGDDIQAAKAGILEIGDILVVNKADRPGADLTTQILQQMLEIGKGSAFEGQQNFHHGFLYQAPIEMAPSDAWQPAIVQTCAIKQEGTDALYDEVNRHHAYLMDSHEWKKREKTRLVREFEQSLKEAVFIRLRSEFPQERYSRVLNGIMEKQFSPNQGVVELMTRTLKKD